MPSRIEQKRQTRRRILQAALTLMGDERSFATLSLREVAREAGIAPTSFYRHFRDMDELAVALVDEGISKLESVMRRARNQGVKRGQTAVTSVEVFFEFLTKNENWFRFMQREKNGGSKTFRRAINIAVKRFTQQFLGEEIERVNQRSGRRAADPEIVADALICLLFNVGGEAMDLPEEALPELTERLITQMRLVLLGAEVYVEKYGSEGEE